MEVSLKNQNLFRFLNAIICWGTDRACLAQSALFFLSSDYDYLEAQSGAAQVSACKDQHFSSTGKGHELETPGLALEGLSKPQGTAGLQSLQEGLQQPVPRTEQSPGTGGVG